MLQTIFGKLRESYHPKVSQVCKRFFFIIEKYFAGACLGNKVYLCNEKYYFLKDIVVICGCEMFLTAPNIVNIFYYHGQISYLDDLEFKIQFTSDDRAIRIIGVRVKPHPLLFCCGERLKYEVTNHNSHDATKFLRYIRKEFKYEYFASNKFNTYLYQGMVATDDYVLKISENYSLEMM